MSRSEGRAPSARRSRWPSQSIAFHLSHTFQLHSTPIGPLRWPQRQTSAGRPLKVYISRLGRANQSIHHLFPRFSSLWYRYPIDTTRLRSNMNTNTGIGSYAAGSTNSVSGVSLVEGPCIGQYVPPPEPAALPYGYRQMGPAPAMSGSSGSGSREHPVLVVSTPSPVTTAYLVPVIALSTGSLMVQCGADSSLGTPHRPQSPLFCSAETGQVARADPIRVARADPIRARSR